MADKQDLEARLDADLQLKTLKIIARVWIVGRMVGPELLNATLAEKGKQLDKAFTIAEEIIERSIKTDGVLMPDLDPKDFPWMIDLDRLIVSLRQRGVHIYRKDADSLALKGDTNTVTPEERQVLKDRKQFLMTIYEEDF